jgi:hypothetical protein
VIEKYTPQLVSWNGGGFDLPVLNYRALVNGIPASRFWDLGEDDREFKWNNYISRYHARHTDLMDVLAMYQTRANAPLDALAKMCGFPGKLGMDGSQVWHAFQDGRIEEIRNYCETDVVNTYLLYCRFQLMRRVSGGVRSIAACASQRRRGVLSGRCVDRPQRRIVVGGCGSSTISPSPNSLSGSRRCLRVPPIVPRTVRPEARRKRPPRRVCPLCLLSPRFSKSNRSTWKRVA